MDAAASSDESRKPMARVRCITEMGMGVDVHGRDATKAARRAVSDAIRHSSLGFFRMLGRRAAKADGFIATKPAGPLSLGLKNRSIDLAFWQVREYVNYMGQEQKPFSGTVVRVEPDGFGIVEFDKMVGANTHGVFSTIISSTLPFRDMKPGVHVSGLAEISDRDLAAVKTIELD